MTASKLLILTLIAGLASPALADHHKGKGKNKAKEKAAKHEMAEPENVNRAKMKMDDSLVSGKKGGVEFSIEEQRVLGAYSVETKTKSKTLPKGLQKKVARGGELPPGWQKKLARGEVISQEVYAHAKPLPEHILVKLPPQPEGTITVRIEGEIVRLAKATMTIIDILGR